jgi:hypothetical protein
VRDLTAEIMNLQAAGDGAKAAELLRTRAVMRPEVKAVLDRLTKVPVDIEPRFPRRRSCCRAAQRTPLPPASGRAD